MVLIHGDDEYLRSLYVDRLRETLEGAYAGVDVVRYDESASLADVLDECRSPGLMVPHKLVVLDGAGEVLKERGAGSGDDGEEGNEPSGGSGSGGARGKRARQLVERYCEAPAEDATLVLRSRTKVTGNLATKIIPAGGRVIDCSAFSAAEAAGWLIKHAGARGAPIDTGAASALIERVGSETGRLVTELAKLQALAEARGEASISRELVREVVGMTSEEKAWSIQRPLLAADAEAALRSLAELLDLAREPMVLVRWSIVDLASKLHAAAAGLEAGVPRGDLAKQLRLWGGSDRAAFAVAERAGRPRLAQLLRECVEADARGKSGGGDERRGVERLVVRFASLASGSADASGRAR